MVLLLDMIKAMVAVLRFFAVNSVNIAALFSLRLHLHIAQMTIGNLKFV